MSTTKPIASLSIDLDNQWSYLKTHGDAGWETFPSYLDLVVPRILALLAELELTATFFIVGQDAALKVNHAALRSIADAGHEIGNHSFHHNPWMHQYSTEQLEAELAQAEEQIELATGRHPIGYRAPGYSFSQSTLVALQRRGYLYDASTLPTFIGPLARAYYFMSARLTTEGREQRSELFGSLRDGLRPLKPYRWRLGDEEGRAELIEIPVTTFPIIRFPFHISYIEYLASISRRLALRYYRSALTLCRLTGTQPSLLLHPLDFLGGDDLSELAFFPAMGLESGQKLGIVKEALARLAGKFRVLSIREHAHIVDRLPHRLLAEHRLGVGESA